MDGWMPGQMDGGRDGWMASSWLRLLSVKCKDIFLSFLPSSSHCFSLICFITCVVVFIPSSYRFSPCGWVTRIPDFGRMWWAAAGVRFLHVFSVHCLSSIWVFSQPFLTSSATWLPGCMSFVATWALAWVFLAASSGFACADLYQLCWRCDKRADSCASLPVCLRSSTVVDFFEFPPV